MSTGGSKPYDFKAESQAALAGANLPKSPLSKGLSQQLQGMMPGVLNSMGNAQNMGAAVMGQFFQPQQTNFQQPGSAKMQKWAGPMSDGSQQQSQGYDLGIPQLQTSQLGAVQNPGQLDPNIMAQMQQAISVPGTQFNDPFSAVAQQLSGQIQGQQFGGIPNIQQMIQAALSGQGNPLAGGAPAMPGAINGLGQGSVGQVDPAQFNAQGGFTPMNPAAFQAQGVNIDASQINPQDTQFYQSIQDLFSRNQQKDVAELRARYGMDGIGRSTGAGFAEGNYRAESLGQLGTALGQLRSQEFQNLLSQKGLAQQGQLQNAQMLNDATLAGRGQDIQAGGMNAQFGLQNADMLNNAALTGRGQDLQAMLANITNQLQQQGLNQDALLQQRGQDITGRGQTLDATLNGAGLQNNNLAALLNAFTSMRGQDVSASQGVMDANLQRLGLLTQNAQNMGQNNLGQNQLTSQNALQAAGLNTDRMSALLGQQNQFLGNQMDFLTGNRQIDAQNSQFNANQGNQLNSLIATLNQQAVENMLNRQMTGQQNILQLLGQLGLAGIPGGGANVNISPQTQPNQSSGIGGILGGLGDLAGGIAGWFK